MKLKRICLMVLIFAMILTICIPVSAASGEAGSGTGGGAGGDVNISQGSGTMEWCAPGVTMQVVLYPYGESSNRNSAYGNVVNTLQTYYAGDVLTVYNGLSITSNTFVSDLTTGRVYKVPNLDINTKTFSFRGGYRSGTGAASATIHAGVNNCVSGPATVTKGKYSYDSIVTMPAMNDVEKFIQRIILGNSVGAWDKHSVNINAEGVKGGATTPAEDVSTFANVLRYLGCDDQYIQNYLDGYNGKLDTAADYDVMIPTIIWSYVLAEVTTTPTSNNNGDGALPYWYYDNDSINYGNGQTFQDYYFESSRQNSNQHNYWYNGHIYTVGDMVTSAAANNGKGNAVEGFHTWWKTAYAIGEGGSSATTVAYNDLVGGCGWKVQSSYGCNFLLGAKHNYGSSHGVSQTRNYCQFANGSGFVNHIYAGGVDDEESDRYYFRGYWTPYGERDLPTSATFAIIKSIDASDECIAQIRDNPLYSLAGAEYQIMVDGEVTEILVTDADGKAVSSMEYDIGTVVMVKEIKAPPGFKLNTSEYVFTISYVNAFSVSDEPVFDPPFAITKVDKHTGNPQGDTSFSGAIFMWEYYANTDWSGEPTRTWYFTTNAQGYAFYNPAYLTPDYTSDDLYIAADGDYQIPLGTIRITELQNPLGYIVMPQPVLCSIVADDSTTSGTNIIWSEESLQFIADMTSGNFGLYEPIDVTLFGSLVVEKVDSITGRIPQGGGTLQGAKFQVINNSANSVKIGDFPEAAPGEVCYEFYTDANGRYETGEIFPLGSYTVKEATPPTGYTLNTTWSHSFTVTVDQLDFAFTTDNDMACENTPILGGLQIIKQDSVLGSNTGKDALLDGITFSVISENFYPVVVNGETYHAGDTVLTMEIKWNGSRWTANTGGAILPYGTYTVKENPMSAGSDKANPYYYLNAAPQTVQIEAHNAIVDLTFTNTQQTGAIQIHKVNYAGDYLAGAKLLLEWSEDGINWQPVTFSTQAGVIKGTCSSEGLENGCLITDETGIITFSGLHPGLQYRVTELEAPNGYSLLTDYAFVGPLPTNTFSVRQDVVNARPYVLPASGIYGGFIPVTIGTCVAILPVAGSIYLFRRKKKII